MNYFDHSQVKGVKNTGSESFTLEVSYQAI